MRTVVATEEGTIEVNWMWLPSFIGMNSQIKLELEKEVSDKFIGAYLNEKTLNEANDLVIKCLQSKFKALKGLEQYLDCLKYVSVI